MSTSVTGISAATEKGPSELLQASVIPMRVQTWSLRSSMLFGPGLIATAKHYNKAKQQQMLGSFSSFVTVTFSSVSIATLQHEAES
eukprot:3519669-Amphidinium_carterae.1